MRELRILCVHGVGRHPVGGAWEQDWAGAIHSALGGAAPDISPVIEYVHYDDIFAGHKIGFFDALEAFGKLVGNAVGSIFRGAPRGATARGGSGSLRWTAGMVVQWVENDDLRRQTRRRMRDRIRSVDPHLICAHSLGSLISYDAFTDDGADLVDDRTLLTFGSQIGNPFVAGSFLGGRIVPLATAKQWTHLYNEEDDVFAAPIRLHADNFEQIDTFFDLPGVADHSAVEYLEHPHAVADFWHDFAFTATERRRLRARPVRANLRWAAPPKKRALLVGINDYPDDSMRLAGCVNDVYLMSALLQETGYAPEDIRVVLDDRATADGIRTRLDWLLDRAGPGHERVLYYSGHGAQMPSYGLGDRVDHSDETLVPHDFDWTPETAITDDEFYGLYSQLPYETQFTAVFDCCHSAGLTRDGAARIRGVNPPDDVRHRALRWDEKTGMWLERDLDTPSFTDKHSKVVASAATNRLGHGLCLRTIPRAAQKRLRKKLDHFGPYMPLLLYACREDEYAYEYRHGQTSYGAFTYSLVKWVRDHRRGRSKAVTFHDLIDAVTAVITEQLQFEQHPQIAGPDVWKDSTVPMTVTKRRRRRRKKRK